MLWSSGHPEQSRIGWTCTECGKFEVGTAFGSQLHLLSSPRALHPGQFPMYGQPGPLSQLDRERLAAGARYYSGIPPPHGLGLDPNDPMVSKFLWPGLNPSAQWCLWAEVVRLWFK